MLADVAGNAREEMEVATQLKVRAHLQSVCAVLRYLSWVRSHVTLLQAAPCGSHESRHALKQAWVANPWDELGSRRSHDAASRALRRVWGARAGAWAGEAKQQRAGAEAHYR